MSKKQEQDQAHNPGTITIKLKNGKELTTTKGEEIEAFFNSNGATISERSRSQSRGGGKSKGARNKGQQKVRRPGSA